MENISLTTEKIKQEIINLLNSNKLPPVIIYYMIKDISNQIEIDYMNYINEQLKKEQEQKKKETGIE